MIADEMLKICHLFDKQMLVVSVDAPAECERLVTGRGVGLELQGDTLTELVAKNLQYSIYRAGLDQPWVIVKSTPACGMGEWYVLVSRVWPIEMGLALMKGAAHA